MCNRNRTTGSDGMKLFDDLSSRQRRVKRIGGAARVRAGFSSRVAPRQRS